MYQVTRNNKYKDLEDRGIYDSLKNTHMYEENKQYIHFFSYYDFAKYYYELGKNGRYGQPNAECILFMVANIPNEILEKYKGFGFYHVNGEEMENLIVLFKNLLNDAYEKDISKKVKSALTTKRLNGEINIKFK